MNYQQIKLLSKIKKLITSDKRRFAIRKDRDYVEELLGLGITESEAWNYILRLNVHSYFPDPKPEYYKNGESLTFKRQINGELAYIKLKVEKIEGEEEVVCLSFHKASQIKGE